jgi:octaheme c-type cytochrome (tetrathionate reductase family)
VQEPKKFKGKKMFYPPDYNKVAQSVGRPDRKNCGTCHFYGGGGDGVKHGDLDSSLVDPSKSLDVHMNSEGADFTCVRCHTTDAHKIAGRCYKKPAAEELKSLIDDDLIDRITCVSCHTSEPHEPGHKANDHTDKVACQSCHIPEFARVLPTKMMWDWSTAGDLKDGKPYTKTGDHGKHSYATIKGTFRWEKNVVPQYFWFNGELDYTLLTDTIDPSKPVELNKVVGDKDDPRSRIYPFKVHVGKQPYDKGNNTMAALHLFSPKEDDAYWGSFDWQKSISSGMRMMGLDYSGEYDFVDTVYYFQITHMVAPKEDSLECSQCHSRHGRLANLAGFYMPGRDFSSPLNVIGWLVVIGSLVGVIIHGVLRAVTSKK